MRVLTIVGARPQFVKASAVSRALAKGHEERLLHTGQHRDDDLSRSFFDDLGVPSPGVQLDVRGLSGGARLSAMTRGVLAEIEARRPDVALVYGDTDSTLAGALAAHAAGLPLAHVEAGLRSGVLGMPEERNRIVVDHLADILLAPTPEAAANLEREGAAGALSVVGDVMLDVTQRVAASVASDASATPPGAASGAPGGEYYAATLHRERNVLDRARLAAIAGALSALDRPVLLACHPRTRDCLDAAGLGADRGSLRLLPPLRYGEMLGLVRGARAVLTDSGGLQKEAYFLGVPCVTLRDETEWRGTLEGGWNRLVGADPERIRAAVAALGDDRGERDLERFGGGRAAARAVAAIVDWHRARSSG